MDWVWQSKIAAKDDSEDTKDEGKDGRRREIFNS
jgi:hypothetical protein